MLAEAFFATDWTGFILGSVLDISKSGELFATLRRCDQKRIVTIILLRTPKNFPDIYQEFNYLG